MPPVGEVTSECEAKKLKTSTAILVTCGMVMLLLSGCGKSPLRELYKPKPYKDVTASPEYNFASFSGTVCKTKVSVALADVKRYSGRFEPILLVPIHYDVSNTDYVSGPEKHIFSILPTGTRLQIGRLMKDQGVWGGVQVEAILLDGTNAQKSVYLDPLLLVRNRWFGGLGSITNWGVEPKFLEIVSDSSH